MRRRNKGRWRDKTSSLLIGLGGNKLNKRQAKKRMNKAIKSGVGVLIITQAWIDEAGRKCDVMQKNARLIILKRPKIQYSKPAKYRKIIE